MNKEQLIAGALSEFQKTMEEAQKKLMEDFQQLLKQAVSEAEKRVQQGESSEIASLEAQLDTL